MIELFTTPLSREQLDDAIEKAKTVQGFVRPVPQRVAMALRRPEPPDLSGFAVGSVLPVSLSACGKIASPDFMALCSALQGLAEKCWLTFDIGQSGTPFDVEETSDLELRVGFDWLGPMVCLQVGAVSAGSRDLAFRKELFEQLVESAGFADRISLALEDGELCITGDGVENADNGKPQETLAAAAAGTQFYRINAGTLQGRNFRDLYLWLTPSDDHEAITKRCVQHFVSLGAVVRQRVTVGCASAVYDEVREIVAANCALTDWQVECMAKQKYDLDTIDLMLSETQSMLTPLFEVKDRKVDEIFVDLHHDAATLLLSFVNEGNDPNESEKAIQKLALDLGVELDETPL